MKNNHINVEGLVAIVKMMYGDDEAKLQTTRDISGECATVTDSNRCEAAFKILECTKHAHQTRGLKFGEM